MSSFLKLAEGDKANDTFVPASNDASSLSVNF